VQQLTAAQNKLDRYVPICATLTCSTSLPYFDSRHVVHSMAIELAQEIGKRVTMATEENNGNNIFVPAPIRGSSEGVCGLLPEYFTHRVTRCHSCLHFFTFII